MSTVVYSSPVMFGQGLEWKDSTGSECCQANTMEGWGKGLRVFFQGGIIIVYMESGMSKEEVRR